MTINLHSKGFRQRNFESFEILKIFAFSFSKMAAGWYSDQTRYPELSTSITGGIITLRWMVDQTHNTTSSTCNLGYLRALRQLRQNSKTKMSNFSSAFFKHLTIKIIIVITIIEVLQSFFRDSTNTHPTDQLLF